MALRYRRMKSSDVDGCVSVIASHPVYSPRYGHNLVHLAPALRACLSLESLRAIVFEETLPDGAVRLMGAGVFVFVTDQFLAAAKSPPFFWIGPDLARLVCSKRSPLLPNDDLRAANALGGLNAVTWLWGISPDDIHRLEVRKHAMEAFYLEMRGFRLKELLGQGTVIEEIESALRSGGFLIGSDGRPMDSPDRPLSEVVGKPHVFCMTRDLMNKDFGSWTSALFVHQEPQIGFSPCEQRLLEEALRGGTDEEIAHELEISLSAVKKAWHSVYGRVESSSVGILPKSSSDSDLGDRGKGKKHRLLAYIREHLEELRPVSMKLLRESQCSRPSSSHDNKHLSTRA